MPLTKRIIEPVNISRVHVPSQGMRNELECVTNHTLANVIRQLSSLSRLAEDMFSELTQETTAVFNRASQLQRRIENVQDKVTQLNATVEEVNLQDIHLKKPFKSSVTKEQQVISRSTVPRAILEIYSKCDTPPALDKLNTFREDGKDSMKFYTDPTYFVELWVQEMDKQIQENKSELSKKRERRRKPRAHSDVRKPREIKDSKEKWRQQAQGVEFTDQQYTAENRASQPIANGPYPAHYPQHHQSAELPDHVRLSSNQPYINANAVPGYANHEPAIHQSPGSGQNQRQSIGRNMGSPQGRPSAPPPAPPPPMGRGQSPGDREILPPPPLPPSQTHGSPGMNRVRGHSKRGSPARQGPGHPSSLMHPTAEPLPPPPPPPPEMPDADSYVPPPPPSPPMPPYTGGGGVSEPPLPPPPPPPPAPPAPPVFAPPINGHLGPNDQGDSASVSSASTSTGGREDTKQAQGNDRSALLAEIIAVDILLMPLKIKEGRQKEDKQTGKCSLEDVNTGNLCPAFILMTSYSRLASSTDAVQTGLCAGNKRLRKVEDREQKKKHSSGAIAGGFDIQALMERARDMRRRVIEDSDDDEADAGSAEEDNWDSD
ncbi:hypothetical protein BaRGS_00016734 [Batillaria attramentaria]|uniref:Wiskott-Aldrich syndrome protein family member n=1 Tax=Batillaria attramentaria TaxID=370345 RepID=A0ABD0KZ13_9CAEN